MALQPTDGSLFGRYRIGRRLGHGGMGVVHAATDTMLGREVALKLVAAHLADDDEFRTRFSREATLLARLDSDRTVDIYDHGEQDGYLYISTRLIDGGDMAALLRESGPLVPPLAVHLTDQVLEALSDAHAVGITHRDVKPANVLVRRKGDRTEAFLCDFGIATMAGAQLTRTGGVSGSLSWMAPERHEGEDAGVAGDIYSAGCLLWFALTAAAPYAGTEVEVALGHLQGPIPQLPGQDPFSTGVNAVLTRALAKDPAARYPNAAAMRADLAALSLAPAAVVLPEHTSIRHRVGTPAVGTPAASPPQRRRRAAFIAVAAVLAVLAGAFGVRSLISGGGDPTTLTSGSPVTRTVSLSPQADVSPSVKATKHKHHAKPGESDVVAPEPLPSALPVPTRGAAPATTTRTREAQAAPPVTRTTSAAPTPPAPAYVCWTGTKSVTRAACGWPSGVRGARWMVGSRLTGCYKASPNSSYIAESYGCAYGAGGNSRVYVFRSYSSGDARAYLLGAMKNDRIENGWSAGGSYAGQAIQGTLGSGTSKRYRWGRYWASNEGAWAVYVTAVSPAERDNGIAVVRDVCRPLADIQARPLS
ncbi:serine/threonine-protein kinase [Nocardioides montaniterrae]